jgi:tetratricopeptide (TPR) repeat protein
MRSRSKHIKGLLFALSLSLVLFAPAAMSYVDPAFDQGLIKMKAADYDGAAECFGESLGLNPNDPRSLVLRGECFLQNGQLRLRYSRLHHCYPVCTKQHPRLFDPRHLP